MLKNLANFRLIRPHLGPTRGHKSAMSQVLVFLRNETVLVCFSRWHVNKGYLRIVRRSEPLEAAATTSFGLWRWFQAKTSLLCLCEIGLGDCVHLWLSLEYCKAWAHDHSALLAAANATFTTTSTQERTKKKVTISSAIGNKSISRNLLSFL